MRNIGSNPTVGQCRFAVDMTNTAKDRECHHPHGPFPTASVPMFIFILLTFVFAMSHKIGKLLLFLQLTQFYVASCEKTWIKQRHI